jgi:hypothetical protein
MENEVKPTIDKKKQEKTGSVTIPDTPPEPLTPIENKPEGVSTLRDANFRRVDFVSDKI